MKLLIWTKLITCKPMKEMNPLITRWSVKGTNPLITRRSVKETNPNFMKKTSFTIQCTDRINKPLKDLFEINTHIFGMRISLLNNKFFMKGKER